MLVRERGSRDIRPGIPAVSRVRNTRVFQVPEEDISRVTNEDEDLYGREYWFSYQERHLGQPTILSRSRSDLPGAVPLLVAHGPEVQATTGPSAGDWRLPRGVRRHAPMGWIRRDGPRDQPVGSRLCPPNLSGADVLGLSEDHCIPRASFDMIALMDVLEHLRDPTTTMQHCLRVLKSDGILVIQTPCYVEGRSYEEIGGRELPLSPRPCSPASIYICSAAAQLPISAHGWRRGMCAFEPALFADYDMFSIVSRVPMVTDTTPHLERPLDTTPAARMVQALLDLDAQLDDMKGRNIPSEVDRAARLRLIEEQGRQLGEVEAERNNLES